MTPPLNRRGFLKLSALALGALALTAYERQPARQDEHTAPAPIPFPPPLDGRDYPTETLGRITHPVSVSVYRQPNDKSTILFQRFKDDLINLYDEVIPETGPSWNPRWYRVFGGYVHSAYVQRVKVRFNTTLDKIAEAGQLCEVSVPYTQTFLVNRYGYAGWQPYYQLYYASTHWAIGVETGPDGMAWYRLKDELTDEEYLVPACHMRPIPDTELTPLSPEVPEEQKRIEVRLQAQTLTAYEYDQIVFETKVSTGIPSHAPANGIPTATPTGRFHISSKMPSKHMGVDILTASEQAYNLPGVPWTLFFHEQGYAFHGAYWHDNFGLRMSHGCINMAVADSKWLFRWTDDKFETPLKDRTGWEKRGRGTRVDIL